MRIARGLGFVARAVVYAMIGCFLLFAARHSHSSEAKGFAGAWPRSKSAEAPPYLSASVLGGAPSVVPSYCLSTAVIDPVLAPLPSKLLSVKLLIVALSMISQPCVGLSVTVDPAIRSVLPAPF